jgi:hypothetical protein
VCTQEPETKALKSSARSAAIGPDAASVAGPLIPIDLSVRTTPSNRSGELVIVRLIHFNKGCRLMLSVSYISVTAVTLDERNPRIAHATEPLASAVTQEFIELALGHSAPSDEDRGSSTTYSSLKASIRANKGLIHPIIVTPIDGGGYRALEGNTRVAIYRELAAEEAPGDWSQIPAIIQTGLPEEGEHAIRLQAHLVGPRPWRPYAKAKYLHDLYHNKKLSITQILDFCGGNARRREIEDYIAAYAEMQEHYIPLVAQGPPDYSRFSAFVELQGPHVKQAIVQAGYTLDDFAGWVNDSKIDPLQTVRQLPRILNNADAKRQFLTHNAREALKVLEQPSSNAVIRSATLDQLATALAVKIRSLNWPDVQALMANREGPQAQSLIDCFEELRALAKQLGHEADA